MSNDKCPDTGELKIVPKIVLLGIFLLGVTISLLIAGYPNYLGYFTTNPENVLTSECAKRTKSNTKVGDTNKFHGTAMSPFKTKQKPKANPGNSYFMWCFDSNQRYSDISFIKTSLNIHLYLPCHYTNLSTCLDI